MSLNLDTSTWQRVAFGDVIDSITERVDNPSEAGVDRYVGLEHLEPGVMTVQRWDSPDKVEAQKLRFKPGDVIFGRRRAYQKKVARPAFEGICSAHALVLRARPGLMDPDFLPVFLSSDYFLDRAISISVGSLSPTVNWRDLKVQEFLLPPVPEQKRLAALFWALEAHIEAVGHRQRAVADALVMQLNYELTREVDQRSLRSVVERIVDCPHNTAPSDASAYALVIGTPDIREGRLLLAGARPVSEQTFRDWTSRATPTAGDLILAREAPIGEVAIVPVQPRVCLGQRTVLIRPTEPSSSRILWGILRSGSVQRAMLMKSAGSTVPHLNVADIRDLTIPWPDTEQARRRVLRLIDQEESAVELAREEVATQKRVREALMVQAFGGE